MINTRFLRIQLKRIWIPILLIGLVVGGFTAVAFGGHYLAPYSETVSNGSSSSSTFHNVSLNLAIYYRSILFGFFLSYLFIVVVRLLLVEQEKGHVASWLISPMTRWSIFATKYLAMIIGVLIISVWVLLLQLILYGATMADFGKYVGYIFLSNFDVLVAVFFFASIMWFIGSFFTRQWIPILIIVMIISWCGIASMIGVLGGADAFNKQWMRNMNYVSLFSLIHTPFERFAMPEFDPNLPIVSGTTIQMGRILPIKAVDYAWQIPLMAILGVGFFIGSQFVLKNKDYNV